MAGVLNWGGLSGRISRYITRETKTKKCIIPSYSFFHANNLPDGPIFLPLLRLDLRRTNDFKICILFIILEFGWIHGVVGTTWNPICCPKVVRKAQTGNERSNGNPDGTIFENRPDTGTNGPSSSSYCFKYRLRHIREGHRLDHEFLSI